MVSGDRAAARRVRFAPSPTGSLHLGNARTALFNWLVARQTGGRFVLRIEDTDVAREQAGSERAILEDLRWLGLDWDEGPEVGGDVGPYRQSERTRHYAAAAEALLAREAAFRCFCSEEALAQERAARLSAGRAPHYSGRCAALDPEESARRAAAGEAFAVRFAVERAAGGDADVAFVDLLRGEVRFSVAELGDTVILRSDGRPTYNFAVVVDDAAMRIDLVIRGDDHLSNTPRQVLLHRALGQSLPEFAHLPLVRGPDGSRLSKRHGAASVAEYRHAGYPADGLVNYLALLGWAPRGDRTLVERAELVREFELERINLSAAAFDPAKLDWISTQYVQRTEAAELARAVHRHLVEAGTLPDEPLPPGAATWLCELAELLRPYLSHVGQAPERAAPVFHGGGAPHDEAGREALERPAGRAVVERLAERAASSSIVDVEAWKAQVAHLREETGAKGRELFEPLRIAITGDSSGPLLDALVPLVERGARLFPGAIPTIAERGRRTLEWLGQR